MVCPSYSLRKDCAPRISPVAERMDDGYLIAKFVLLMLFTLADALHIRLVNRVNLFLTMTPLCKNRLKSFNQLSVNRTRSKIALEFSD